MRGSVSLMGGMGISSFGPVSEEFQAPHLISLHARHVSPWYEA